ncbi:RCC1/BLIP-II protein [Aspergillus sclerotioniger CBS 115572]|uniref:RCC1/BLIP-II protein n=1 Tax=Aspergillus sclerotioniger CBS 115572 TaxID=1450535 RepID=A0A317VT36_9EURO|nr:RCC1/BLIP-II protein [Aspergillus sclerotioniger CBS 115572]PWY76102.1 RCC1/BLIP-II protein [Aspergillus sclerotioniger CBS 115572]
MELFGCGDNSAGDLGEPACCVRRYVNEPHRCQHNNDGKDSPYCPLWVLKPRQVFRAVRKIRVIYCENDADFFDIDGELKHRGDDPLKHHSLAEATQSWNINALVSAARLADGFIFLTEDGTLSTVRDTVGVQSFSRIPIQHIATRRVDYHNPNLISGAVAIVLKQDPQTVLSFDSWKPFCSFLESSEPNQAPTYTATFSSPIVKLTSRFAALTESGEVFMWGDDLPEQPPTPSDYDEDEWMDALFEHDFRHKPIEKWPSWEPKLLDYEPRRQPLPPIRTLSTGGVNDVAVSRSGQLFVWGYRTNKWPEIEDANDRDSAEFKEAFIPTADTALKIKSAAAGRNHIIVLAVNGSLWSVGEGLQGQLGIGLRQFGLCTEGNVIDMLANETDEEFAVSWERMDTEALVGRKCEEVFADGEHSLILTSSRP